MQRDIAAGHLIELAAGIGQGTPRLQRKPDDGAEPGGAQLHDPHRGRLQREGQGERRDVLGQLDRVRVDALSHPLEVVRLAEAEGEPVEVARPGGRTCCRPRDGR